MLFRSIVVVNLINILRGSLCNFSKLVSRHLKESLIEQSELNNFEEDYCTVRHYIVKLLVNKQERILDIYWSEPRLILPHRGAGESIVLLLNSRGQLVLRQALQPAPASLLLKLGPSWVSNKNLGPLGLDAAVQPGPEAVSQGFVIEHVSKEDEVISPGV